MGFVLGLIAGLVAGVLLADKIKPVFMKIIAKFKKNKY